MQVSTFNSKAFGLDYVYEDNGNDKHYASEYCISALSPLTGRLR